MTAEIDRSAGYFPRYITTGDPHIEPDKPPVGGNLFEVACVLARLLGEFVEQGNREQLQWVFSAVQHLKEHAGTHFEEIHGEALSDC